MRRFAGSSTDCGPPALDELGLASAITEQAARLETQGDGLRVTVAADGDLTQLPAAVEVAAYRIALEALTNVARHARAQTCSVRLALADELVIEVDDNGIGVAPEARWGVGLASMRERCENWAETSKCAVATVVARGCAPSFP